jgi:hypothetical protein
LNEGRNDNGPNHKPKPDGHKPTHDREDCHSRDRKSSKDGECSGIFGVILFVFYSMLIFLAFKLYRAAKNYERVIQRPPVHAQPYYPYAPMAYPANVPMGSMVQH